MRSALIIVDMLNPYDHEEADRLTDSVEHVIEPISLLVERAIGAIFYMTPLEYLAEAALKMMERNMRAEVVSAADCRLEE